MIVYTLSDIVTTETALRRVNYWKGVDLAQVLAQEPTDSGCWKQGAEPPDPDAPDYPGGVVYRTLADAVLAFDNYRSANVWIYEVVLGPLLTGPLEGTPFSSWWAPDMLWARDTNPLDVAKVFGGGEWSNQTYLIRYYTINYPYDLNRPRYLRVHAPIRGRVEQEQIATIRGRNNWAAGPFDDMRIKILNGTLGLVPAPPPAPPPPAKLDETVRQLAWEQARAERMDPVEPPDDYTIRAGSRLSFVSVGMIVHPPDCANCERGGHPTVCSPLVTGFYSTERSRERMVTLLYHNGLQAELEVSELERNWRLARDFDQTQDYTGRWGETPLGSAWPVAETAEVKITSAPMTRGQRAFLELLGLGEDEE